MSDEEKQNDVEELTAKHLEMEHLYHQYKFSHEENPKQPEVHTQSIEVTFSKAKAKKIIKLADFTFGKHFTLAV